jgi:hypothetical protein
VSAAVVLAATGLAAGRVAITAIATPDPTIASRPFFPQNLCACI